MTTKTTIKRRRLLLCRFSGALTILLGVLWSSAIQGQTGVGIPEPGLIIYGVVRNTDGNVRLTSGSLVCQIRSNGVPVVTLSTNLQNINDQFSYLLQVPFETSVGGVSANTLELKNPSPNYSRHITINGITAQFVTGPQTNFTFSLRDRGRQDRVDLEVSLSAPDSDGDGLPDWWETQYFAGNASPHGDPDGDRMTNMQEYRAGTIPTNSQSVFQFIDIGEDGHPGIVVRWSSITNKTYNILRSGNVSTGYALIQTNLGAMPPINFFRDTNATGAGPFFYRLTVSY